MKNYLIILFTVFIFCTNSCLKEGCEDTEAPEINFGLLMGGDVLIIIKQGDDEIDVTEHYDQSDFIMSYYKVYCDGTSRGPFATEFKVSENGTLVKQSIGYMSFRMDNTKDYIYINFEIQETTINGQYRVYYDSLKPHDGNNANIDFTLKLVWNDGNCTAESIVASIN